MPKSMQTRYRDDIVVKVNLQIPIPTSFCTTVQLHCAWLSLQKGSFLWNSLKFSILIKTILKKHWKDVGMAYQKVCKQGRNDIIVKLNLQSPSCYPYIFLHYSCKPDPPPKSRKRVWCSERHFLLHGAGPTALKMSYLHFTLVSEWTLYPSEYRTPHTLFTSE